MSGELARASVVVEPDRPQFDNKMSSLMSAFSRGVDRLQKAAKPIKIAVAFNNAGLDRARAQFSKAVSAKYTIKVSTSVNRTALERQLNWIKSNLNRTVHVKFAVDDSTARTKIESLRNSMRRISASVNIDVSKAISQWKALKSSLLRPIKVPVRLDFSAARAATSKFKKSILSSAIAVKIAVNDSLLKSKLSKLRASLKSIVIAISLNITKAASQYSAFRKYVIRKLVIPVKLDLSSAKSVVAEFKKSSTSKIYVNLSVMTSVAKKQYMAFRKFASKPLFNVKNIVLLGAYEKYRAFRKFASRSLNALFNLSISPATNATIARAQAALARLRLRARIPITMTGGQAPAAGARQPRGGGRGGAGYGGYVVGFTAMYAAKAAISSVTSAAGDFEHEMVRVRAIMGLLGPQGEATFGKLNKLARELGANTIFSPKDAAEAFSILAQKGMEANQIMQATPAVLQLAAAAGIEMAQAAEFATGAMGAYGLAANQLTRVNDIMLSSIDKTAMDIFQLNEALKNSAGTASQLKVKFSDLTAMIGMMAKSNVTGGRAGQALAIMFQRLLVQTKQTTVALQTNLARTGRTMSEFFDNGVLRGGKFVELLKALQAGGDKVSPERFLGDISAIVGARGKDVQKLFSYVDEGGRRGMAAFDALANSIANDVGRAQTNADAMASGWYGATKRMQSATEELAISLGDSLIGPFGKLVDKFAVVVGAMSAFNIESKGMVAQLLVAGATFATIAAGLGALTVAFSVPGVVAVPIGVIAAAGAAAAFAYLRWRDAIAETVKKFMALNPVAIAVANFVKNAVSKIISAWNAMSAFVVRVWTENKDTILEALGNIQEIAENVITGIVSVWDESINWIGELFAQVFGVDSINFLTTLSGKFIAFGADVLNEISILSTNWGKAWLQMKDLTILAMQLASVKVLSLMQETIFGLEEMFHVLSDSIATMMVDALSVGFEKILSLADSALGKLMPELALMAKAIRASGFGDGKQTRDSLKEQQAEEAKKRKTEREKGGLLTPAIDTMQKGAEATAEGIAARRAEMVAERDKKRADKKKAEEDFDFEKWRKDRRKKPKDDKAASGNGGPGKSPGGTEGGSAGGAEEAGKKKKGDSASFVDLEEFQKKFTASLFGDKDPEKETAKNTADIVKLLEEQKRGPQAGGPKVKNPEVVKLHEDLDKIRKIGNLNPKARDAIKGALPSIPGAIGGFLGAGGGPGGLLGAGLGVAKGLLGKKPAVPAGAKKAEKKGLAGFFGELFGAGVGQMTIPGMMQPGEKPPPIPGSPEAKEASLLRGRGKEADKLRFKKEQEEKARLAKEKDDRKKGVLPEFQGGNVTSALGGMAYWLAKSFEDGAKKIKPTAKPSGASRGRGRGKPGVGGKQDPLFFPEESDGSPPAVPNEVSFNFGNVSPDSLMAGADSNKTAMDLKRLEGLQSKNNDIGENIVRAVKEINTGYA